MAKRKQVSETEKLQEQKRDSIQEWEEKIHRIPEPSYRMKKGEEARFRKCQTDIIEDVLFDGKAYGFVTNQDGKMYYHVIPWAQVKPVKGGDSCFAQKDNLRLNFLHYDLDSIIDEYYSQGINMDPDYQRGFVWDDTDRELLIDSIFNNIGIGTFVLARTPDYMYFDEHFGYEIIDGKQRLSTIISFYENRFPYRGKFFNDLSTDDQRFFLRTDIQIAKISQYNKSEILKYFIILNKTGKKMDLDHIKKIEKIVANQ